MLRLITSIERGIQQLVLTSQIKFLEEFTLEKTKLENGEEIERKKEKEGERKKKEGERSEKSSSERDGGKTFTKLILK